MDTFHLFGEDGGGAGDKGSGDVDGVAGEGGGGEDKDAGGESGDVGKGTGVGVGGGAAGGQSVAKLKTLDGEAFRSCLEMSFEHMVRKRVLPVFCLSFTCLVVCVSFALCLSCVCSLPAPGLSPCVFVCACVSIDRVYEPDMMLSTRSGLRCFSL